MELFVRAFWLFAWQEPVEIGRCRFIYDEHGLEDHAMELLVSTLRLLAR